jgi:hypothetical protein
MWTAILKNAVDGIAAWAYMATATVIQKNVHYRDEKHIIVIIKCKHTKPSHFGGKHPREVE